MLVPVLVGACEKHTDDDEEWQRFPPDLRCLVRPTLNVRVQGMDFSTDREAYGDGT